MRSDLQWVSGFDIRAKNKLPGPPGPSLANSQHLPLTDDYLVLKISVDAILARHLPTLYI